MAILPADRVGRLWRWFADQTARQLFGKAFNWLLTILFGAGWAKSAADATHTARSVSQEASMSPLTAPAHGLASWPWYAVVLAAVVLTLLFLLVWAFIDTRSERGPLPGRPWLQRLLEGDRARLDELLKLGVRWDTNGLMAPTEKAIDALVEVTNASVFDVQIAGGDGEIKIDRQPCRLAYKVSPRGIRHGETATIRISQPLMAETVNHLAVDRALHGQPAEIALNEFRLIAEITGPCYAGHRVKVPFGKAYTVALPEYGSSAPAQTAQEGGGVITLPALPKSQP